MGENELSYQAFMDTLYTKEKILRWERLYGHSWFTPGGEAKMKEFIPKLNLQPGDRVLDIGCGSGGSAVYLAKTYRVHVHGVDISSSMIDIARGRLTREDKDVRDKVHFELADITKVDYDSNSFDVIYSLGAILFIAEKDCFFKNLYKWLKPGGTLLIVDICGDQEQYSEAYVEFIKKRRYQLKPIKDYSKWIESAGFKDLTAMDNTNAMTKVMEKDLVHFQATREDFVKDFCEEHFNSIEKDFKARVDWCRTSQQIWGVFQAKK